MCEETGEGGVVLVAAGLASIELRFGTSDALSSLRCSSFQYAGAV